MSDKDYSYDEKCEALAEYFLDGKRPESLKDFAQHIQQAVEDWLEIEEL